MGLLDCFESSCQSNVVLKLQNKMKSYVSGLQNVAEIVRSWQSLRNMRDVRDKELHIPHLTSYIYMISVKMLLISLHLFITMKCPALGIM